MEKRILDHKQVLGILPDRNIRSHKGHFGRLLLLCGSVGYTGAAALSAMGALRSGAGLVFLGVPESVYSILAVKLNEPVVFPLPDCAGKLSVEATEAVWERLQNKDAVLIGPGLGISEGTESVLCRILQDYSGPVVLDADGINMVRTHKDLLRGRTGITVLTPHEGEFVRLGYALTGDRLADAAAAASDLGVIMVLKGHKTVVTDGVTCYTNPTGNPGMAVGGCGDVLAGIITSLLGQHLSPIEAAACGVWLHGAAGDKCAQTLGQYGMLPSDMLQALPLLMK